MGKSFIILKTNLKMLGMKAIALTDEWINNYKQIYELQPFVKQTASNVLEVNTKYLTNPFS